MLVDLFSPFKINHLEIKNRFVRSATGDGTADEAGLVTDTSLAIYGQLAKGGVGLIITGHAFVCLAGQSALGQYGIYDDKTILGLRRMVDVVHRNGSKIAVQLSHSGINSRCADRKNIVMQAVSAKPEIKSLYQEMTDEDIEGVIESFVQAGRRAVEAGFDAVQLHGAHGYLLDQFLSPLYNYREDRWGGSAERRRSFLLEVVSRVRKALGPDYPLLIKLGIKDEREGGLGLSEGIAAARELVVNGIDAIEVSCGIGSAIKIARDNMPKRAYFLDDAVALKKAVDVPVILVGGIRSLKMATDIVNSGGADLISMCRPFMREPGLIKQWAEGLETASGCVSCNRCMAANRPAGLIRCAKIAGD
jgi:2,4-dienoyl-CoA reductase-like NADH-dependent reductase (Old Yellow Enzyme family)